MESRQNTKNKEKLVKNHIERLDQWTRYFDVAQHLTEQNDSNQISLTLNFLMGNNRNDFWRYEGSLTTPPCTENVIWTIFKAQIFILDFQFESFRDDLFFESFRGPQSLFYRNVLRSFKNEIVSSIPDQNCCANKSSKQSFDFLTNFFLFKNKLF